MSSLLTHALVTAVKPQGFPERTFYAEAFTAVASAYHNLPQATIQEFIDSSQKRFETSENARNHLEFLWYAEDLFSEQSGNNTPVFSLPKTFKQTLRVKPTNWLLLRARFYIQHGSILQQFVWKHVALSLLRRNWNGEHILDRGIGACIRGEQKPEYASDQYTAFSLMILTDLYKLTGNKRFKEYFDKGLNKLRDRWRQQSIELTQGRGAYQLFGYASLIYILSWAQSQNPQSTTLTADLDQAIKHLSSFQHDDGLFPLVLKEADDRSDWETYNNLYDYLGFTAAILSRAAFIFPEQYNERST
ncbi:hypothetical protein HOI18_03825 [Candidatus Uhrbacteria bacterium]|nr:hypothetical protein [Candidatus Uhrbacteria bacterium]